MSASASTASMPDASTSEPVSSPVHPALQLTYDEFRTQWRRARTGSGVLRRAMAFNDVLAPRVQMQLASDPYASVRRTLAGNVNLLRTAQEILAEDTNLFVLRSLATNRALIPAVVRRLWERLPEGPWTTNEEYLAMGLANNPALPTDLFQEIVDRSGLPLRVAYAVARNSATPLPLLEEFLDSGSPRLLVNLAANPALPAQWLQELYYDVFLRASKRSTIFDAPTRRQLSWILARNPATPDTVFVHLSVLPSVSVISALAANPSLPQDLFEDLPARYVTTSLRQRLGNNPRWETISVLARDWSGTVADLLDCVQELHPLPDNQTDQD